MSKLNLIEWDILNRVYFCLYARQENYHVVITNVNDALERITITNKNGDKLFTIDRNLNIEAHDTKTREEIANCFIENGIHAS
jgi:hypothetical protein